MSTAKQTNLDGLNRSPKTAILIGAGNRGNVYASYAIYYPEQFKIVGVCDPREYQRNSKQKLHNIPPENVFSDWKEAADRDKFADCVLICTPPRLHKPKGATSRCMDCPAEIENNCPYSAKKLYLEPVRTGSGITYHISVVTDIVDVENVERALRNGPYGKCVYSSDNDVMSNQVVNMQFEGGATASFQMVAFSKKMCVRETKLYGTKGELIVKDGSPPKLKLYDFLTKKTENISIDQTADIPESLRGYGGADFYTIKAFVDALHNVGGDKIQTGPEETLRSHLLVFAAERARKETRVVNLKEDGQYD